MENVIECEPRGGFAGVSPAPSIKAARRWRARPLPRARGLLILANRANGWASSLSEGLGENGGVVFVSF